MYVDTHCHIHDSEFLEKFSDSAEHILERAHGVGVDTCICVGTSLKSSIEAQEFCTTHESCYFSVALHPHEAENYTQAELDDQMKQLAVLVNASPSKLVAIGECGLDYFYHKDKKVRQKQEILFRNHLEIAKKADLPVIFHIRDAQKQDESATGQAFDDFFRILDDYKGIRGVVHSFSATSAELKGALSRGFYIGLNGIMTFTTDEKQLQAAKLVPLEKLVIETDAPFLTPKPFRGRINEPKHVILITQFLSELRGESQALLAKQTTKNAKKLFNL